MSDLSQLKETVIAQARQDGQAAFDAAKREIDERLKERRLRLEDEKQSLRQQRINEETSKHQQMLQQIRNEERQSSLQSKQNVLHELFQGAIETMEQASEDDQLKFFDAVIKRYDSAPISVQWGEKTVQQLSPQTLESLKEKYPHVTFEEQTAANEGGFVVKHKTVEYNYLYEELIRHFQAEESHKIAGEVFKSL